jgi:hypothetical protein
MIINEAQGNRIIDLLGYIHSAISGTGGGAATNVNIVSSLPQLNLEATQLQVVTELQNILAAMAEVSETIWIDATDTFFLRRLVYDEETGGTTISYTLPDGTAYAPTAPIRPASYSEDVELGQTQYIAINAGVGYAAGQFITQVRFYDTTTTPATLVGTIYINDNTNSVITPLIGDLVPRAEYFKSKMERIKGSADYNRVFVYDNPATIGSNVTSITHSGTTALGVETIIETFTYVSVSTIGSNVTDITYS